MRSGAQVGGSSCRSDILFGYLLIVVLALLQGSALDEDTRSNVWAKSKLCFSTQLNFSFRSALIAYFRAMKLQKTDQNAAASAASVPAG